MHKRTPKSTASADPANHERCRLALAATKGKREAERRLSQRAKRSPRQQSERIGRDSARQRRLCLGTWAERAGTASLDVPCPLDVPRLFISSFSLIWGIARNGRLLRQQPSRTALGMTRPCPLDYPYFPYMRDVLHVIGQGLFPALAACFVSSPFLSAVCLFRLFLEDDNCLSSLHPVPFS